MEQKKNNQKNKAFDPYAPHKIKWWGWPLLLLLIVGTVYIIMTRDNKGKNDTTIQQGKPWETQETQRSEGSVFGTFYHLTYQSATSLQEGIDHALKEVDASLSPFNKESVITAINNNTSTDTNPMFVEVFTLAQEVSKETNGAFDITVAPLVNLWGFGFKNEQMPTKEQVDSLRQLVGMQHVSLNGKTIVMQKPGMMLDFSAIAKGYGVDVVARLLESHDIKNFMVEIGGEITTRGINPERVPWKIGVNKPCEDDLNESHELQTILNVTDKSMATSGNYRNFYIKGGKKYAHTIDPKTGRPVQHTLLSATVLADHCAKADAYATSFMVLGMDGAKEILKRHKELMAYLIFTDRKGNLAVWYSPSLQDKIIK